MPKLRPSRVAVNIMKIEDKRYVVPFNNNSKGGTFWGAQNLGYNNASSVTTGVIENTKLIEPKFIDPIKIIVGKTPHIFNIEDANGNRYSVDPGQLYEIIKKHGVNPGGKIPPDVEIEFVNYNENSFLKVVLVGSKIHAECAGRKISKDGQIKKINKSELKYGHAYKTISGNIGVFLGHVAGTDFSIEHITGKANAKVGTYQYRASSAHFSYMHNRHARSLFVKGDYDINDFDLYKLETSISKYRKRMLFIDMFWYRSLDKFKASSNKEQFILSQTGDLRIATSHSYVEDLGLVGLLPKQEDLIKKLRQSELRKISKFLQKSNLKKDHFMAAMALESGPAALIDVEKSKKEMIAPDIEFYLQKKVWHK